MQRHQKHILIGASIAVIALIVVLKLRNTRADMEGAQPEASRVAAVAMVRRGTVTDAITLSGELHPFQEVDLHAKVAGFLKNISVDVGDHVRAGQVIATLEIPELNAELQGADASVSRAHNAIERARSEQQRMKSAHDAFHVGFARLKKASEARSGLIAEQELDDSEAKDKESEAQMETAAASLSEAESQLAMAEASQKQASALSEYSKITVPFNGVITKRYADTGALIQAGTSSNTQAMPIVRVAQIDKLRLVISVPESAVRQVRLGTSVHVRVPALKQAIEGTVSRYADALDQETRTMHTEIDVRNTDNLLVDGMYAEVDILLDKKESTLTLPAQTISRNGSQAIVLMVNAQSRLEQRRIRLGLEGADRVEILEGLAEKDLVLMGGSGQFRPGDKVVPKLSDITNTGGEALR